MKKTCLTLIAALASYCSYAQNSNSNPWPVKGGVGIGTATPKASLEVMPLTSTSGTSGIFHLSGGQAWGHTLTLATDSLTGDDARLLFSYRKKAKQWSLGGFNNTTRFSIWEDSGDGVFGTGWGTERFTVLAGGKVGIGTSTPDALLSVKGTIHAQQVKVDMTGWSDIVFIPSYRLRPLKEVKAYVERNHHLPEVPSEAEVLKNGQDLGEMNKLLLKKVEELTLYLIEKDKKDKDQQNQINELRQKLESLSGKIKDRK